MKSFSSIALAIFFGSVLGFLIGAVCESLASKPSASPTNSAVADFEFSRECVQRCADLEAAIKATNSRLEEARVENLKYRCVADDWFSRISQVIEGHLNIPKDTPVHIVHWEWFHGSNKIENLATADIYSLPDPAIPEPWLKDPTWIKSRASSRAEHPGQTIRPIDKQN